jgi:hypothetical protein
MCRLLFVITGLAVGGAETQLVRVAKRLKQRGWDVRVVTLMPPRAYVDVLEQAGIPVTTLGIRDKRPALRPIWRLARIFANGSQISYTATWCTQTSWRGSCAYCIRTRAGCSAQASRREDAYAIGCTDSLTPFAT